MKHAQPYAMMLAAVVAAGGWAFSLSASAMSPAELQDLVVQMHDNHTKLHEAMVRGEIKQEDILAQKRAAYQAGRITLPPTTHPKLKALEAGLNDGSLSDEAFRKEIQAIRKAGDIPKEEMRPFMQKLMLSGKWQPKERGEGKTNKDGRGKHGKRGTRHGGEAPPDAEPGEF